MANRFWVGGAGTWSTTTTNWSATSGGAGGASVPGASDVAIIDNNSGSGAFTITRTATAAIQGIQVTRTNGAVSLAGSSAWTINGGSGTAGISIASGATFTWDNTGTVTITGNALLGTNGAFIQSAITMNTAGITVALTSSIATFRTFTLGQGTLNLSTFTLTAQYFIGGSTGSRALTFGSGSQIVLDNGVASATSLDLSAGAVTVSGTPSVRMRSYNQAQTLNSGTTRLNFSGVSSGLTDLLSLTFAGLWTDINASGILRIIVGTAASVSGTLNLTSASNLDGSGTLTFDGANQSITLGGISAQPNIAITGTGTFTFADNFTTTGSISHSGTASVQQGASSAVNVQASTLTRSGTNTWNTRGGSITLTGSALSIAAGSTFTSSAAITFSGAPTSGTRTVSVANPTTGSPTVGVTISGSDTVNFGTSVLASLTATSFAGAATGNLTVYSGVSLASATTTALTLTIFAGAGNTISQTIGAINTFSCGSGTVNLTNTGTLLNLSSVGGSIVFNPSGAYSASSVSCSNGGSISINGGSTLSLGTVTVNSGTISANATGAVTAANLVLNSGSFSMGKNISVTNTLTFNSGSLVLNGFTATANTVNFASTTNDINSISVGVVAVNLTITGTGEYIFNSDATVSGNITVSNGTLKLSGYTANCVSFIQSGGLVNFGVGGAVKARVSLSVSAGSASGTGALYLDGDTTLARSVSGVGHVAPVIINDAPSSPAVTINATVPSFNSANLAKPLSGTLTLTGNATLGNHDATGFTISVPVTGVTISTTTPTQPIGALTIGDNDSCTLGSNFRVANATTMTNGSQLTLAGYTFQTGSFSGSTTSTTVNSVIAFGSSGTGRFRVMDGAFYGAKTADSYGVIGSDPETGDPIYGTIPGRSGTSVTGTGVIELAGTASNSFTVSAASGSYAGITLNLATAVTSTIGTGGAVLGNITNSAAGMQVLFKGTGTEASTVNALSLQQVLIGTAVPGVRQDLVYNGAGSIGLYNNLVTGINASPASTWFAQGVNGCIDAGNNAGIAFGTVYTGPRTDQPIYIGRRRLYA